jgi:hypothetical protein
MKIRNGDTPIQLPELIRSGDPITAKWANSIRAALQRLRDRTPLASGSRQYIERNPFQLTLGRNPETDAFFVTVSQGFVVERALSADGAESPLVLHECDNRLDVDGVPTEFEMEIGDAIFVKVLEDDTGKIKGGADLVLVDEATKQSKNFEPPSTDGEYYYKLAELEASDYTVNLVSYLTGSHIYHSTGLTADMVIYDCPPEPGSSEKGTQLIRLSFVSGKLHSVNETEAARPLSPTVVETNTTYCS